MRGIAPAVAPVAGTSTASDAAAVAARAQDAPHILLQAEGTLPPKDAPRGIPKGMSPEEAADRIVAALLAGTGPILLLVPGTLGTEYQTSMLALGRAALREAGTHEQPSIASVPYDNGIGDIVTRYFKKGAKPAANVLALVLQRLQRVAGTRPILLAGESQGAWLIADTLRAQPELAALVTRVAMFANPGFVQVPKQIGSATGQAAEATGIIAWRHTDDIVPNLFRGVLSAPVIGGFRQAIQGLATTGSYTYTPHHYDRYATTAAQWLLDGVRPKATHLASTDPLPT